MLSATMTLSKSEAAFQSSLGTDKHKEESFLHDSRHVHLKSAQTSRLPLCLPLYLVGRDRQPVRQKYLDLVSSDLKFADEVIQDPKLQRYCFNQNSFQDIYAPGNVILPSRKRRNHCKPMSQQRNASTATAMLDMKQNSKDSCLKKQSLISLFPRNKLHSVKNEDTGMDLIPIQCFMTESFVSTSSTYDTNVCVKPTLSNKSNYTGNKSKTVSFNVIDSGTIEYKPDQSKQSMSRTDGSEQNSCKPDKEIEQQKLRTLQVVEGDWDDYMLCQVSASTAHWIVQDCIPESRQRLKLSRMVHSVHGQPSLASLMMKEDPSQEEDGQKKIYKNHVKKWRKKEAIVLDKVYRSLSATKAELCQGRLAEVTQEQTAPAGLQNITSSSEDSSAVNSTAQSVTVVQKMEAPPPKLRDFLSPKVGANLLETDNLYQLEQLTGRRHVYNIKGDPAEILTETSSRYRKQLQPEMPLPVDLWHSPEKPHSGQKSKHSFRVSKPKQGMKRWIDLPVPVNERGHIQLAESEHLGSRKTAVLSASTERGHQNVTLLIVSAWFKKWRPSGYYPDRSLEVLLQDLADIQSSVRLQAIAAIARVLTQHSTWSDTTSPRDSVVNQLGEAGRTVHAALVCLLDDNHGEVRKAAAVTLSAWGELRDKTALILTDMLSSESRVDRWASAGCLAVTGSCDSQVIAEIINQITSAGSGVQYELGIRLLARISNQRLAHCLVSERLNSSSSQDRATACRILASLPGDLNKDMSAKLAELMWCDWHEEVRTLSARCLARKDQGQLVHDSIRENLLSGSELKMLEALRKIGLLGVMTVRLLPVFLGCFSSSCPSIRAQVCLASGCLQIQDDQVMARLLDLATSDPSWRVKVVAIQALGKIGVVTGDIRDGLVWALRFETEAAVRAEACRSLVVLKVKDTDLITTLQERLLLESSPLVQEEIDQAFDWLSVSVVEDSETLSSIKSEIHKLGRPELVAKQILELESADTRRGQVQDMLVVSGQDGETIEDNNKSKYMFSSVKNIYTSRPTKRIHNVRTPSQSLPSVYFPSKTVIDTKLPTLVGHQKPTGHAESGHSSRPPSPDSRLQGLHSADRVEQDDQQAYQTAEQQIDHQTDQTVDKEKSGTQPSIRVVEVISCDNGDPHFKFEDYDASISPNLNMVGLVTFPPEFMSRSADSPELFPPSLNSPDPLSPSTNSFDFKTTRVDSSSHLAEIHPSAEKLFYDQKVKNGAEEKKNHHRNVADMYDNFAVRYALLADDLVTADKGLNMSEFFYEESKASSLPHTPNDKIENTSGVVS